MDTHFLYSQAVFTMGITVFRGNFFIIHAWSIYEMKNDQFALFIGVPKNF